MRISVICPVYNEEKRVKEILKVLKRSNFIEEIIFVDDGSEDKTFEILKRFQGKRIKVFRLKENKGKGFALGFGIKKSKGEILVFIDGDLKGLKEKHLKDLIKPLLERKAKCTIGVPLEKERKLVRPWEIYFSGERAYFREDLKVHLKKFFSLKYGIEMFLNSLFLPEETKIVFLKGLISPSKFEKKEFKEAMKDYFKETKEIFEESLKIGISFNLVRNLLKGYIKEMMGVWLSGRAHP